MMKKRFDFENVCILLITLFGLALQLAIFGAFIYVVAHFVQKFW